MWRFSCISLSLSWDEEWSYWLKLPRGIVLFSRGGSSVSFLPLARCLSHPPISACWWCRPPKYVDFGLYSVILPCTASSSLHFFSPPPPDQRSGAFPHISTQPSFYFHSQFLFLDAAAAAVNSSPRRDALCVPRCCILSPDRTDALCEWTETRSWTSCRYHVFLHHLFSDSLKAARATFGCLAWKSVPVGVSDGLWKNFISSWRRIDASRLFC